MERSFQQLATRFRESLYCSSHVDGSGWMRSLAPPGRLTGGLRITSSLTNIRLEVLSNKMEFRAETFRHRAGNQPEHLAICRVASATSPLPIGGVKKS
jgi:hypothetical protein